MTGIPIVNVTSYCSSGSTAFNLAYNAVKSGSVECALSLGFEKLPPGPLKMDLQNPTHPGHKHVIPLIESGKYNYDPLASPVLQIFGVAGEQYMKENNISTTDIAKIAQKNFKHGTNNPYALIRKEYSVDQILSSKNL